MNGNESVVVIRLVFFLACALACCVGESMIPPSICSGIKNIEVRYRNYYDIYLGNSLFLPELRMDGIHVRVIEKATAVCCNTTKLKFIFDRTVKTDIEESYVDIVLNDPTSSTFTFFYPEFADKKERQIYATQAEFVALARSPGHAIIMKRPSPIPPVFVGEIFVKSWAILIFLITFAWIIGILAWISDHYKNPTQFPNPFYRGMFEAFWWSVVTMTTVGYGDKSPKGGLGRVLAVIWIMISTVFLSLFTANATSILQISQAEEDHSLTLGKKFGVLNSKHFFESELNLGAQVIEFNDGLSLMMGLDSGIINRLIFPNYLDFLMLLSSPEYASAKDSYQLTNVIDHPFQVGLVFARNSNNLSIYDQALLSCFRAVASGLEKQERTLFDISKISWTGETEKEIKTALDSDSLLTTTYYFFIIIAVLLFFGFCWDGWMYYRKKRKAKRAAAEDVEMDNNPVITNELPTSREPTPTMENWGSGVLSKYRPSNSNNQVCESYSRESLPT